MVTETEEFEVIVDVDIRGNKRQAIARASRLLSEIQQFRDGYIFDVSIYGFNSDNPGVGISFDTDIQIGDDYGLRKFMNACTEHRSILSVERLNKEE